jgi:hypothetical protein
MASTYPTSLDAFTNPTGLSLLTSPDHAQQHSDLNDAVEALEAKVAIGATVLGTYTSYTPTWTNLTVGNGSVGSQYARVNNFVHYYGAFFFGSTSSITGAVSLSLPVNSAGFYNTYNQTYGSANFQDISVGGIYSGEVVGNGTATSALVRCFNTAGTYAIAAAISGTVPMTWATTDRLYWSLYYQAA